MDNIPFTMVLRKHVDVAGIIFYTISGSLAKNSLIEWIIVIRIGTNQKDAEESLCEYKPVSYHCTDV